MFLVLSELAGVSMAQNAEGRARNQRLMMLGLFLYFAELSAVCSKLHLIYLKRKI